MTVTGTDIRDCACASRRDACGSARPGPQWEQTEHPSPKLIHEIEDPNGDTGEHLETDKDGQVLKLRLKRGYNPQPSTPLLHFHQCKSFSCCVKSAEGGETSQ